MGFLRADGADGAVPMDCLTRTLRFPLARLIPFTRVGDEGGRSRRRGGSREDELAGLRVDVPSLAGPLADLRPTFVGQLPKPPPVFGLAGKNGSRWLGSHLVFLGP